MRRLLPLLALLLALAGTAEAQGVGIFSRTNCATISQAVVGQTYCFDQVTNQLKTFNGTSWTSVTSPLGVINVKDTAYGAKGDGVTDDSTAIQAAYNAVPSTGGTVYFPAGVYLTTATILPNAETLTIGAGKNATTIRLTSTVSGRQAFLVTLKNRVSFEKLRIEINGNSQIGLEYAGSQENQIRDLIFYSLVLGNGTGVLVHSSGTPGSFSHSYDSVQYENLAIGIQFGVNGEATGANNHTVINNKATSNGTGYLFTNATNVTLIGSRAESNTSIGIDGAPNVGDLANNITVIGQYLELNTTRHYRVSTRCADWLFMNLTIVGGAYQDNGTNTKFIGNALGTPTGFNIYTNGVLSASIDQNGNFTSTTIAGIPNITGNNLALYGAGASNAIGYKNTGSLFFQTITSGSMAGNTTTAELTANGGWNLKSGGGLTDKGSGTVNAASGYYANNTQFMNASGSLINASYVFANLNLVLTANGMQVYCSDCTAAGALDQTCVGGGSGNLAVRVNGVFKCAY